MKENRAAPIRTQILTVNLMVAAAAILLAMGSTLALTLYQEGQVTDRNLMNSAQVISRVPMVAAALEGGRPTPELYAFLDGAIAQVGDIDVIAVAGADGVQVYYPDRQFVGRPYAGRDQQRILSGEGAFTSDDTGVSGAERCAYAPVAGEDGRLLGFVMVGVYLRSVSGKLWRTAGAYAVIALTAVALGALLSARLSERIKGSLMGYEPAAFLDLFQQREDILEALEEGVMAIDASSRVIYLNRAAADMLSLEQAGAAGRPLSEVYPRSNLDRVLRTRRAEYNVPLLTLAHVRILSDRMPILDRGRLAGAVAIFRNRTEVSRLAEDLTGVRHMVEAMRAYTHEFMNKLHVILGLLQLGETQRAQAYIMDVTSIQQRAVGAILNAVGNPSVAALLVGKTSRCAELGIRLTLGPGSSLSADENILPTDAYVTVLGNLIENAVEALNQGGRGDKEITVSLVEDRESLLICVEDTGPGMDAGMVQNIFRRGFTTKGEARGTGLSLVREVADAYQGQVRVESEPGVGTAFFLSFRREPPQKEESHV